MFARVLAVLSLTGSLSAQAEFTASDAASFAVAAGDLDGDGNVDLITLTGPAADTSQVSLQQDDGSFVHQPLALPIDYEREIRLVDVENDGDLDLVHAATLLLNDGAANFTPAVGRFVPSIQWDDFEAADLDGDGFVDLVVRDPSQSQSGIIETWICWNDGLGGFLTVTQPTPEPGHPAGLVGPADVADFDLDGDLDIWAGGLHINHGARTFTTETLARTPPGFFWAPHVGAAIDLDNDGAVDLLNTYFEIPYRNAGDGTFTLDTSIDFPRVPAVYFDYDQDGDVDTIAHSYFGGVSLGVNDGLWNFDLVELRRGLPLTAHMIVVDLDRDGDLDAVGSISAWINQRSQLAVVNPPVRGSNFELEVRFNAQRTSTTRAAATLVGFAPDDVSVLDWGDLRIDLATATAVGGVQILTPGTPAASWSIPVPIAVPLGLEVYVQSLVVDSFETRFTNRVVRRVL